mgnify:CR=1 FL=1
MNNFNLKDELIKTHGKLAQRDNASSNKTHFIYGTQNHKIRNKKFNLVMKKYIDLQCDIIKNILQEKHEDVYKIIGDVTAALHLEGKKLFPNAACYTIATMFALDLDPRISFKLFITSRIDWWHHVYMCYYRPGPI